MVEFILFTMCRINVFTYIVRVNYLLTLCGDLFMFVVFYFAAFIIVLITHIHFVKLYIRPLYVKFYLVTRIVIIDIS